MAAERPQIPDAIIERFINHVEAIPGDIRSTPESLFYAERRPSGNLARIYMTPCTPEGFAIEKAAFFNAGEQFPYLAVVRPEAGQHLELVRQGKSLTLKAVSGDEAVSALYLQNGQMLESLRMTKGKEGTKEYVNKRFPSIYHALTSKNPALEFTEQGMSYDETERTVEMPVPGGLINAKIAVYTDEILLRYFPVGLRVEPFIIGPDHDVWAQSDWLSDFGLRWERVTISHTPVFVAAETSPES